MVLPFWAEHTSEVRLCCLRRDNATPQPSALSALELQVLRFIDFLNPEVTVWTLLRAILSAFARASQTSACRFIEVDDPCHTVVQVYGICRSELSDWTVRETTRSYPKPLFSAPRSTGFPESAFVHRSKSNVRVTRFSSGFDRCGAAA
jgi:hypothetical protein